MSAGCCPENPNRLPGRPGTASRAGVLAVIPALPTAAPAAAATRPGWRSLPGGHGARFGPRL